MDTLTINEGDHPSMFSGLFCVRYDNFQIKPHDQCVFWLNEEGKAMFSMQNISAMALAPTEHPTASAVAADWLDDHRDELLDTYTGTVDRLEAEVRLHLLTEYLRSGLQISA